MNRAKKRILGSDKRTEKTNRLNDTNRLAAGLSAGSFGSFIGNDDEAVPLMSDDFRVKYIENNNITNKKFQSAFSVKGMETVTLVKKKNDNKKSSSPLHADSIDLTAKELEVLKWVQEGKTNEEIGIILGRTKWTVKFHLKNIMKKLDVTSRTQAVSKSIGLGYLSSTIEGGGYSSDVDVVNVGLIGCGKGGESILNIFKDNNAINVAWAADDNMDRPGIRLAKDLGIRVSDNYRTLLKHPVDVIVNVTGAHSITDDLRKQSLADTEIMGGVSAKLMWQLIEERRKRFEDRERMLKQHEALYHLGLVIESIDSLVDAGSAIIDFATNLTGTPAGSIAIFDERKEEMQMIASKGFSAQFKRTDRWQLRKGGLTSKILNQSGPFMIEDIRRLESPNPMLLREGAISLLAAPLVVERKIVGILYVNDFKSRTFRTEDISLFSLLTIYAGLTIERVRSIEEMRRLSITDGLTSLYNQRYLMEQMEKEVLRAGRHGRPTTVIMIDIDNFKAYNDSFGHMEGNKVLKKISRILSKSSRLTDTVGRFGGEEFCIILPEIDKEGAVGYAERLVRDIAAMKDKNRKVTISAGVATFPEDATRHHNLLQKADEKLYEAKENGRNKVCY